MTRENPVIAEKARQPVTGNKPTSPLSGGSPVPVWCYLYNRALADAPLSASGDWLA